MKIGIKLAVIISAVNLACIGGLTATALAITSNQTSKMAMENVGTVTEITANQVRIFLEVPLDAIRALAQFMSHIEAGIEPEYRRNILNVMLHSIALENPNFLAVWAAFEPNALDGNDAAHINTIGSDATGRFLSTFSNINGSIVHAALGDYANSGSAGNYYQTSLRSGREAVIEPFRNTVAGREALVTSLTVPIFRGGRVIGVAGVNIELTEIQSVVNQIKPFGDGLSGLFSNSGLIVSHPDPIRLGRVVQETERDVVGDHLDDMVRSITTGTAFNGVVLSPASNTNMILVIRSLYVGNSTTSWSVATFVPERTVMAEVRQMQTIFFVLGGAMLVIITLLVLLVSRSVTAPLKSMEAVVEYIGEGDFTHTLNIRSKDEIGNISRSLNNALDKMKKLIRTVKEEAAELSGIGSELAMNMEETNAAIRQIDGTIQQLQDKSVTQSAGVTETNATVEQITVNIGKLNDQVEKQAVSVSQSSSAIEEMLANIQSVTQTLVKNMENVNALTSASEVGHSGLQDVAHDIQEIAHESEGLLEINGVMESIASQTNLLSMNAAIEAAHAGASGKGFAVVADEIRKLAESSSDQSKTIGGVLKKITESINKITKSTENVLEKFEAIDSTIKIVADQEGSIRNAMEEQGHGSKQILTAVGSLNEITRHVKSESDEMYANSKEVIKEGKNLERLTLETSGGIIEVTKSTHQIMEAIKSVNELSALNSKKMDILMKEVSRFKIE